MNGPTGGPAFPVTSYIDMDGEIHDSYITGMTLREYYAGQALAGLCANVGRRLADVPETAWKLADEMIATRFQEVDARKPE